VSRELSTETARRMVQRIRPEWTVHENTPITSGTDAVSFITVETKHRARETVLKACTAVPPEEFRPEPYLLSLLETNTSVPGPHVLGAVDDHGDLPAPFFLMERCKGVLAGDIALTPKMRERMARAAGRFAGEYHAVGDFEQFGRIHLDCDRSNPWVGMTVDGRTLAVADDAAISWRAYFRDMYDGWIHDLDDEFLDLRSDLEEFIEPRFNTLDCSFDSVLGHIDYKPRNILIRPETGETTAVLDWGHATAMEPYYDLLLTETHLSRWAPLSSDIRMRIREALVEGYAETNSLGRGSQSKQRRELYLAVAHLQPLVWFSKWTEDVSDDERRQRAAKHRAFYEELLV
jgi:aminoglycoside phosphotransferase (APT) family kinase protein